MSRPRDIQFKEKSETAIQNAYARILSTGVQLQILSAPTELRLDLYRVSERVKPLLAEGHLDDHASTSLVEQIMEDVHKIASAVPGYSVMGLKGLTSASTKPELRRVIQINAALLEPLGLLRQKCQENQENALLQLRRAITNEDTSNNNAKETEREARLKFRNAQKELISVEEDILIVTFFGEDVLQLRDQLLNTTTLP